LATIEPTRQYPLAVQPARVDQPMRKEEQQVSPGEQATV
jgi:hypothetical protein